MIISNDSKSIGCDKTTSPGDGGGDGTELRAVSGLNFLTNLTHTSSAKEVGCGSCHILWIISLKETNSLL